jgi:hypothetical protein
MSLEGQNKEELCNYQINALGVEPCSWLHLHLLGAKSLA